MTTMESGRRLETLLVIGTASVLSALDLFVVNLAFSSLQASFPDTTNQVLSWVLSAYSIAFAAVLVPAGRLADRHGRKKVFRLGLALFGVSSAACALAPDVGVLIAARAAKGVGAAMMVPTSLGLLLSAYPRERHTQMVAIWSATGSVAAALGPVIGGALVEISWRLIFMINVPLTIIATWRSSRLPEDERSSGAPTPDLLGSAALASGIAALVVAISYLPDWGLFGPATLTTLALSMALLAVFLWRCVHHPSPALDLGMFRSAPFLASTIGMGVFYAGFAMMLLGGTLYLTTVWGWTALHAGQGFALGPLTAVATALVAGRRAAPPRAMVWVGAASFVVASLVWWARLDAESAWLTRYLPGVLLFGAGAGVAQTGFLVGGTSALPASDYATGTAVLNTARQLGAAIGVALFVALAGEARAPGAYAPAWIAIGACALLSAVVVQLAGRAERRVASTALA